MPREVLILISVLVIISLYGISRNLAANAANIGQGKKYKHFYAEDFCRNILNSNSSLKQKEQLGKQTLSAQLPGEALEQKRFSSLQLLPFYKRSDPYHSEHKD